MSEQELRGPGNCARPATKLAMADAEGSPDLGALPDGLEMVRVMSMELGIDRKTSPPALISMMCMHFANRERSNRESNMFSNISFFILIQSDFTMSLSFSNVFESM